ncbi:EAL domain-containing protein [Sphingomonas daechungensis]|uniref:EAL domain-containing protein n=1 Tax=Sphingomonas daechungensis TaxID=1176646 RepID=A0ABX6T0H0_9SPHN|nr:EAL domain-containing protein [Sphingomonas daechungensis]QNP42402.1 EAL domain-containing protein [Sphingomonas daechungensis]
MKWSLTCSRELLPALARAVVLPAALTLALLAAMVGTILHFSTSESDRIALERQDRLVRIAVRETMDDVAVDQEASTFWDDAVVQVRKTPLDPLWLDNNLGIWFHTYYRHDETYLLNAQDKAVYAMQAGRRARPASFARVAGPVLKLADGLRRKLTTGYLAPEGSRGKTIGATDFALVAGHPAIISVKPIVSETGNVPQRPGSEFLHVSVRYLDGSFLSELTELYGIDAPRFTSERAETASLPIAGRGGAVIGYLDWAPFEPGEEVEDKMSPVLIVALGLIGVLIGLLLLRLFRSRLELEASRAQAQHLAFHDSLTGLPNRALFEDRLDHALAKRDCKLAVMLLDLDRFKNVNDTLGHQAGDALIRELGVRLAGLTREADTVSRLGGDEFAILIENCRPADLHRLARRILTEINQPFTLIGNTVHVGVSIGIVISSVEKNDRLELVRKADIALYNAKDAGRNTYCLFEPHMDDHVRLRGRIEEDLRAALASGHGLCLHYQPQVASDGKVIGLEALVRWDHPQRGMIAPEQFVPVAEETGLILPLGEWVFRQACVQSLRWPGLFIAINLSPLQIRSNGFYDTLAGIIRSTGADPRVLQLEVTERVLLDDDDKVRETLAKLRKAGFTIVLDDFGTGYSSLSYLRKFEVDKIKIDRSFIQHLGETADSANIISAVLALGHVMGLEVAAEGVETAEQQAFLKVAGCKEMQGYYFSRALPAIELGEFLPANSPKPISSAA